MNVLTTVGRVITDVTVDDVNGRKVAKFRFAANNREKKSDGTYGSNFYSVSAWGAVGEMAAKFLQKGFRATLSGELTIRPYTTSDGQQRFDNQLTVNVLALGETKAEAEAKSGATGSVPASASARSESGSGFTQVETDELPF